MAPVGTPTDSCDITTTTTITVAVYGYKDKAKLFLSLSIGRRPRDLFVKEHEEASCVEGSMARTNSQGKVCLVETRVPGAVGVSCGIYQFMHDWTDETAFRVRPELRRSRRGRTGSFMIGPLLPKQTATGPWDQLNLEMTCAMVVHHPFRISRLAFSRFRCVSCLSRYNGYGVRIDERGTDTWPLKDCRRGMLVKLSTVLSAGLLCLASYYLGMATQMGAEQAELKNT